MMLASLSTGGRMGPLLPRPGEELMSRRKIVGAVGSSSRLNDSVAEKQMRLLTLQPMSLEHRSTSQ